MTTPTREQVVQWAEQSGVVIYSQVADETIGVLADFSTAARADLEATIEELTEKLSTREDDLRVEQMWVQMHAKTIEEQAAAIAKLQTENELLKQVEANLCELHNVALTELESLRKDAERYRWLRNEARSVDWSQWINIHNGTYFCHCRTILSGFDQTIDAAIAAAPKQEK